MSIDSFIFINGLIETFRDLVSKFICVGLFSVDFFFFFSTSSHPIHP